MLASRGLRFLASRCRPAPLYTWSVKTRAPMDVNTTTTWYIRPPAMTASYSKDSKNVFTSSLINQKRLNSSTAPQPDTITNPMPTTSPPSSPSTKSSTTVPESSSTKNPQALSSESQAKAPSPPPDQSSDACTTSSKTPSPSKQSLSSFVTDKCSKTTPDSPIQPPNIKLPSRDQVEKYFFTALVYVWDFCYYVFCLTLRLIDTYILKNAKLQEYWKMLTKRLDEQRQALKSKK